jgi:hypothetical protein
MNELAIRSAVPSDWSHLRRAVIELQEYERRLHLTRLPGEQIADAYLTWMQQQVAKDGAVLVAEIKGAFVGFVAGWIEEEDHIAETPDSNRFGYISDICVPWSADRRSAASRVGKASWPRGRQALAHRLCCGEPISASDL